MISVGVDAGSRAIKIVLLDTGGREVIASGIVAQGIGSNDLANDLLRDLMERSGLGPGDVVRVVATGYARNMMDFADTTVTEITCHARGVHCVAPNAATVVEIGGQDSKLLRLGPGGSVRDFSMNDRCAAGTGRFLEVVADRLGVPLDGLGPMASRSRIPASISSTCIVFAETEIIGLLSMGTSPEDIVAGVQNSIAIRIAAMAGRGVAEPVVFTGGVAIVPGMDRALESALGCLVSIAPNPQFTGALGAAIIAAGNFALGGGRRTGPRPTERGPGYFHRTADWLRSGRASCAGGTGRGSDAGRLGQFHIGRLLLDHIRNALVARDIDNDSGGLGERPEVGIELIVFGCLLHGKLFLDDVFYIVELGDLLGSPGFSPHDYPRSCRGERLAYFADGQGERRVADDLRNVLLDPAYPQLAARAFRGRILLHGGCDGWEIDAAGDKLIGPIRQCLGRNADSADLDLFRSYQRGVLLATRLVVGFLHLIIRDRDALGVQVDQRLLRRDLVLEVIQGSSPVS